MGLPQAIEKDDAKQTAHDWRDLEHSGVAVRRALPGKLAYYWKDPIADYWDDHWDGDIGLPSYESAEKGSLGELGPAFLKHLPIPGTILEAGCGRGHLVLALRGYGFDCVGVDFAKKTVALVNKLRPDIPVSVGDVTKLDVPDGFYSGYISLGVIEHREEGPEPFLREAYRILAEDGVAIFTMPHFSPLRRLKARLGCFQKSIEGLEFYQYAYSNKEIRKIFELFGFTVIDSYQYNAVKGLSDELPRFSFFKQQPVFTQMLRRWTKNQQWFADFAGHSILFVCKKQSLGLQNPNTAQSIFKVLSYRRCRLNAHPASLTHAFTNGRLCYYLTDEALGTNDEYHQSREQEILSNINNSPIRLELKTLIGDYLPKNGSLILSNDTPRDRLSNQLLVSANSVDVCLSFGLQEEFSAFSDAYSKELRRILRRSGLGIIVVPKMRFSDQVARFAAWRNSFGGSLTFLDRAYTMATLARLLNDSGFRILERKIIGNSIIIVFRQFRLHKSNSNTNRAPQITKPTSWPRLESKRLAERRYSLGLVLYYRRERDPNYAIALIESELSPTLVRRAKSGNLGELRRIFRKFLCAKPKVLIIDSGLGHTVKALQALGVQCEGVLANEELLEACKKTYDSLPVRVGSKFVIDAESETYDAFVSMRGLQNPRTAALELAEAYRVIKPGGIAIIAADRLSPLVRAKCQLGAFRHETPNLVFDHAAYKEEAIQQMISEAGFTCVQTEAFEAFGGLSENVPFLSTLLKISFVGSKIRTLCRRSRTLKTFAGNRLVIVCKK